MIGSDTNRARRPWTLSEGGSMINLYDMEPIWIESEEGQEMIIPKSPVIRKTEQLSLSEQMDILAEQVRDALSGKREQ